MKNQILRISKNFLSVCIASLAFFFTCCVSTNKTDISDCSPAALISITGTKLVNWKSEKIYDSDEDDTDNDGILNGLLNSSINKNSPEITTATDRLDYADESARKILPEFAGLQILDKQTVFSSEFYKAKGRAIMNSLEYKTKATGYKDISSIGGKAARILMREVNANSLIILDFSFKKKLADGTRKDGLIAGFTAMNVKFLDRTGKIIINKGYECYSDKKIKIQDGYYSQTELVELLKNNIDLCLTQFALDFSKNLENESDFEADNENVKSSELAAEENKNESAETSDISGASVPAASAKLGKPKNMQK